VDVRGTYAYVADGTYGLRVLTLANPMHPMNAGYYYNTNTSNAAPCSAGVCRISADYYCFGIYDISYFAACLVRRAHPGHW